MRFQSNCWVLFDMVSFDPLVQVFSSDSVDRFCPDLDCLVPDDPAQAYEVREVISTVSDDGRWHEVGSHAARNIVTGFARLGGSSVGVVANAPAVLSGCVDGPAASKVCVALSGFGQLEVHGVGLADRRRSCGHWGTASKEWM